MILLTPISTRTYTLFPYTTLFRSRLLERLERAVHRSRPDPVQPATPVLPARRGERGTRQLFGIQPVRNLLRRVAPLRQRAGHRLGGALVSETRPVAVACAVGHGSQLWAFAPHPPSGGGVGGGGGAFREPA